MSESDNSPIAVDAITEELGDAEITICIWRQYERKRGIRKRAGVERYCKDRFVEVVDDVLHRERRGLFGEHYGESFYRITRREHAIKMHGAAQCGDRRRFGRRKSTIATDDRRQQTENEVKIAPGHWNDERLTAESRTGFGRDGPIFLPGS